MCRSTTPYVYRNCVTQGNEKFTFTARLLRNENLILECKCFQSSLPIPPLYDRIFSCSYWLVIKHQNIELKFPVVEYSKSRVKIWRENSSFIPWSMRFVKIIFKNSVPTSKKRVSITMIDWLMLYRKTIAVYSQNHGKSIVKICGKYV
jgi:hypothetical protein